MANPENLSVVPFTKLTIPQRQARITVTSTKIQYSQTVLLNFGQLSWPHVSVATLTPNQPIIIPPSVWD